MAEIATVLAVANAGFKLSITLFSFAAAIRAVDKEILRTAKDISLFSQVLKLLAATLERGSRSKCISASAFETSAKLVEECRSLFEELEGLIKKSTSTKRVVRMGWEDDNAEDVDKVIVPLTKQIKYFFNHRNKVDSLRRNLESLKTSLQVMLSVLNFAENIVAREASDQTVSQDPKFRATLLAQERLEIESLILANEAAVAEIRKHDKTDVKDFKFRTSKNTSSTDQAEQAVAKPFITSIGIIGEVIKKDHSQRPSHYHGWKPPSAGNSPSPLTYSSVDYLPVVDAFLESLPPVPAVFPSMQPPKGVSQEKPVSSVGTQDRAELINHLLALWSPKVGTIIPGDKPEEAQMPAELDGGSKMAEESSDEEMVDLFPKRSRPY